MNIVMIGAGYVGLISGVCFSEFGANVTCIDVDESKIDQLNKGEIPIYEPGLKRLIAKNVNAGRLKFSINYDKTIKMADLVFIAVGTPARHGDGHADLSYVYAAAKGIAKSLNKYTVIIIKSTVPVGTARQVSHIIKEENSSADFDIVSNPEFLREGVAINDFMQPDRVILGVESERAEVLLKELYYPLNVSKTPILVTDFESAEMIKYASNAFLATKISFINEISILCEKTGANVQIIAKGMGLDKRIGNEFLNVSPGYGGSCLPKDALTLIRMSQEHECSSRIIESVVEVNIEHKVRMVVKILNAFGGSVSEKKISILGLTFKPGTDDMRDAPALTILPALLDKGARIHVHDPKGFREAKTLLPDDTIYCESIEDAVNESDGIVLMTEWDEYKNLDLKLIKNLMKGNVFVDLHNIYELDIMNKNGYNYVSVGRGPF